MHYICVHICLRSLPFIRSCHCRCDGSNNFYGDPVKFPNTSCSQCICSGNIDFSVPNSCNTTTGQCTLCINNSTGSNCDQCLSGFYGNASIQTCQTCQCNSVGSVTLFCESNSGQCYCRPNVAGRQCDSCLPDHFNFNSLGCSSCLCDETGSNQSQCDLSTGQCSCKSGVGGQTCAECSLGYFNFSSAGCSPCLCGTGSVNQTCDMNTGYCYCQPGVNGAKCDQCLPFYENLTSSGCSSCDACTEQLGNRAMSIAANELTQVAAKVSELETVSEVGESSLSSHLTVSRAINSSLQQYKEELTQHHDKIIEINAGAINGSADAIDSYLSLIAMRSDGEGVGTGDEFMRIRELALSVEMALGLLEQTQTATSFLVPMLQSQVSVAMSVLQAARQLLSLAQFNYSANVYQAMETLSDAEMTFDRSLQVSMQLSSQQSQISDLNQIVISLNASLLRLQSSLNNLKERNEDNTRFISEIRSILIRTNTSVMDFYGILTTIRSRIIDIRYQLNASVQVYRLAEDLYTSAADTLRGSLQAEQSHNLESGDSYIRNNITTLKQLHSDLTQLLAQAEVHRLELTANTSLIESAYNSTQPAALDANKAITDYQEVNRLINAACILANSSLQVATEAAQQSATLIQQGILEQVALELRVARTLLNISLQLRENVSYLTSEELALLQANLSLLLQISSEVEGEVNQANQFLIEIEPLTQFYVDHVNGILTPLPDHKSCISSNSLLVGKFLSQIESIIPQLIRRISNCSDRIQEYNALGERADSLINSTISALVDRVQSISTSVNLSDSNMGKLQYLESKVGVIEAIRDRAFAAVARFKIALALQRNYSFTYRIPNANVALEYTQVSLYFKPTLTTGLLFYAQTSSRQFISLHLDEGVLVFSIELGLGLKNISIGGVLPQQWYQVLATRDGKQLTMSLAEQSIGENQISKVEGNIDFSESLLFPPNESLFLGHKPEQANVIDVQNFEGCVQDLSFNHMPISLFNPIENVTTLSCGIRPVTRRYTNGTWFYGGGYLVFTQPHLPHSSLLISFRTFNDGILGSTSNNEQSIMFTLAITGGNIEFSIRETQFLESLGSTISVVDGKDHEVSILIDRNRISLQVDQVSSGQLQLRRTNFSLASLNIGGDPGSAVSESFSGVVTELRINGLLADLSQALNVSRVVPFSPVDVTPGAYHSGTGYAQFSLPQSTMPLFSLQFSFRSTALTGLLILLFAADSGASPIHLSLEHGRLMFSFMYLNVPVIRQGFITLGDNLNDGNFHLVRVEIMSDSAILSVDQLSMTSPNFFCESCEIIVSTPLFVGGVPDSKRLLLPFVTSYKGCIRNLVLNDIIYNYTDANFTSGVSLYGCEPAIEPPTPTTMPPITPTVSPSFPSSSSPVLPTFIATQSLSQSTSTPTPLPTSIPTLQTSLLPTVATFLTSIPFTSDIPESTSVVFSPSLSSSDAILSSVTRPSLTTTPFLSSPFMTTPLLPPTPTAISSVVPIPSSTVPDTATLSSVFVSATLPISTPTPTILLTPSLDRTSTPPVIPTPSLMSPVIPTPSLMPPVISTPSSMSPVISTPSSMPPVILTPSLMPPVISTPSSMSPVISTPSSMSPVISTPSSMPPVILTPSIPPVIPSSSIPPVIPSSSIPPVIPSSSIPPVILSSSIPPVIPSSSIPSVIFTSSSIPVFPTSLSTAPFTPTRSSILQFMSTSSAISPIITTISSLPTITPTPTPTPTPLPVNACQIYPDKSLLEPESSGFRFDSFNGSYVLLNVNATELATDTVFRIEFSSITYNGNIFFVNGKNNFDFIELKFVAGKIRFSFSLGSFPIHIITSYRYDDGIKYRVEATRLGTIGLLTVLQIVGKNIYRPREYLRSQVDDTAFTKFDLSNNFYFGGLPNEEVSADMCVTSLVINKLERLLSSGSQYRVNRCYSKISRGATFSGSESYLRLLESFPVGRNLTVQFDFRTFNQSGLLFYIANPVTGDHVTLELGQGSLVYSVDNGEIPIVITYTPPSPYTLCNGLWHSVLLTKQDNDISITVDGTRLENSISDSFVSVDTKSYPLFLGGIESGLAILSHVSVVPFRGCIREVLLNGEFYSLSSPQAANNQVIVAGCII